MGEHAYCALIVSHHLSSHAWSSMCGIFNRRGLPALVYTILINAGITTTRCAGTQCGVMSISAPSVNVSRESTEATTLWISQKLLQLLAERSSFGFMATTVLVLLTTGGGWKGAKNISGNRKEGLGITRQLLAVFDTFDRPAPLGACLVYLDSHCTILSTFITCASCRKSRPL